MEKFTTRMSEMLLTCKYDSPIALADDRRGNTPGRGAEAFRRDADRIDLRPRLRPGGARAASRRSARLSPGLLDQVAGVAQQLAHLPPQLDHLGSVEPVLERVPVARPAVGPARAAVHPVATPILHRRRPARAPAPGR